MADKRKTTSRSSQVTQSRPKASQKPVKTISEMARDEVAEESIVSQDASNASSKTTKSVKDTKSQSTIVAPVTPTPRAAKETSVRKAESAEPAKTTRAAAMPSRVEQRKTRRDAKQPSWLARLRRTRFGNFVYEAYYELRHKVTWPTFEEARNMTAVVIVLSAVIGAFLAAVDYGLYNLFLLISGGR